MAETTPDGPPRRRPRRLPLPTSQPPYDDEIGVPPTPHPGRRIAGGGPTQGALALSFTAGTGVAPAPESHPRLRLVGEDAQPAAASHHPPGLPDPRRWTVKLAQAAFEGVHGQRPIQQLTRWTDDAVYRSLARRAADQAATSVVRPRVRSIRVCRVSDLVAEASVVVTLGARIRAVAVRLDAVDDRWLCTTFDIIDGGPVSR